MDAGVSRMRMVWARTAALALTGGAACSCSQFLPSHVESDDQWQSSMERAGQARVGLGAQPGWRFAPFNPAISCN